MLILHTHTFFFYISFVTYYLAQAHMKTVPTILLHGSTDPSSLVHLLNIWLILIRISARNKSVALSARFDVLPCLNTSPQIYSQNEFYILVFYDPVLK